MNQYSTRRERIDDAFRARVEAGVSPYTATGNTDPTGGAGRDPASLPLAMVYAPESTFTDIYGDEEGLSRGTIFSDLYFPFECSSCRGSGGAM